MPSVALRSARVKLLAFSDLHRDLERAGRLAEMAGDADVVIAAGDFASIHRGLPHCRSRFAGPRAADKDSYSALSRR